MTLIKGQKGRFAHSGREFEIIDTTMTSHTVIRFRFERDEIAVADSDLRDNAENIYNWTEPK